MKEVEEVMEEEEEVECARMMRSSFFPSPHLLWKLTTLGGSFYLALLRVNIASLCLVNNIASVNIASLCLTGTTSVWQEEASSYLQLLRRLSG